ncbi:MAG TPA: hypothetical protein ACFYEL_03370, partial [Candidatus Wunengus californicus]|uniref:hypothetical protein n=1 Tax=Candidatus Wunengus californicus TaxID=3367619 RepID=UPI0040299D61
ALLIGYYFYQQTNRYYITGAGTGVAYEVDKKTGQTWFLLHGKKRTIVEQEYKPQNEFGVFKPSVQWEDIAVLPQYQELDIRQKRKVLNNFIIERFSSLPEFKQLPIEHKAKLQYNMEKIAGITGENNPFEQPQPVPTAQKYQPDIFGEITTGTKSENNISKK